MACKAQAGSEPGRELFVLLRAGTGERIFRCHVRSESEPVCHPGWLKPTFVLRFTFTGAGSCVTSGCTCVVYTKWKIKSGILKDRHKFMLKFGYITLTTSHPFPLNLKCWFFKPVWMFVELCDSAPLQGWVVSSLETGAEFTNSTIVVVWSSRLCCDLMVNPCHEWRRTRRDSTLTSGSWWSTASPWWASWMASTDIPSTTSAYALVSPVCGEPERCSSMKITNEVGWLGECWAPGSPS